MKMCRSVTRTVVSLLAVALSGLARPANPVTPPITTVIPVSGIVSGQPENVLFSGRAQISSELVLDPSRLKHSPAVILIVDLSGVSGTGSSSRATYVIAGDGTGILRRLASADAIEVTFPFARGALAPSSTSLVRTGVASFVLSFDLGTGAVTGGTATIAAPDFPQRTRP